MSDFVSGVGIVFWSVIALAVVGTWARFAVGAARRHVGDISTGIHDDDDHRITDAADEFDYDAGPYDFDHDGRPFYLDNDRSRRLDGTGL